jgi:hypothetical protein
MMSKKAPTEDSVTDKMRQYAIDKKASKRQKLQGWEQRCREE